MSGAHVLLAALYDAVEPLYGVPSDFDLVLQRAQQAQCVLLGEASHGTHEFYRLRAEMTKRLIVEQGVTAVAVEADWPDAYRVNRFVRGEGHDVDAAEALGDFHRFPQWMWRNADVLDFVGWLRTHNDAQPADRKVGFYGLDLYSMHASIDAVLRYLDLVDPIAAQDARVRYACLEHFREDPQAYGRAVREGLSASCEDAVVEQLVALRRAAPGYAQQDGRLEPDDLFYAEQNARIVARAERYYRAMIGGRAKSWNLRDRHMVETLEALVRFQAGQGRVPKVVLWAHNSHLGDARATEMHAHDEVNIGQLLRERIGSQALLVGFLTYNGTVTAAPAWDAPAERMVVKPALPESYEALFHSIGIPRFLLDLGVPGFVAGELARSRLERAIGVIYRPDTERYSHYFSASLPNQFDLLFFHDTTRAVEPLERVGSFERSDVPETFPSAL